MKKSDTPVQKKSLPHIESSAQYGLSSAQASERMAAGLVNSAVEAPTRSVKQIILSNVFTYFNIVFFVLALCVLFVGSFRDLLFMPVILINMCVGIVQELRSKKVLDELAILTAQKVCVVRDGNISSINATDCVLDDVIVLESGNQICADAVILEGSVSVNESLITGEADELEKSVGDKLLSGSFIVSGNCRARLEHVGADSFVSKLTLETKKEMKRERSEMMAALTKLVKWIGIAIIPIGIILFDNQYRILQLGLQRSVVTTVAALVGMIPEGLYLLTTVALTVSVRRLAKQKVVVQDLGCIEALARVDVLCVDKTGTITEPAMQVNELILLCPDRFDESDIHGIMADYLAASKDNNDTSQAMRQFFSQKSTQKAEKVLEFSSSLKYGGVSFGEGFTFVLGAPENIVSDFGDKAETVQKALDSGCRVLLLALYDSELSKKALDTSASMPLALILLTNKIRSDAPETFRFFGSEDVDIKVISGDNPASVSAIARMAEIKNADSYADARSLESDKQLRQAVESCGVLGRVIPEQKRKIIRALKNRGHTVAMVGDGVNDALALKEADCSVAMASGSDVARQVSQLVLLDSNFSAMPSVVTEGRRVINNIELVASLFLVKNIFSIFLSLISVIADIQYPITASQLSLVSTMTIGIPSFFLALEPNPKRVTGHFMQNVLFRALPAGLTDVVLVSFVLMFSVAFNMPIESLSTVSVFVLAVVGLIMLYRVCSPFNRFRKILFGGILTSVIFCVLFLEDIFALSPLSFGDFLIFIVLALLARPTMKFWLTIVDKIAEFVKNHKLSLPFRKKS